MDKIWKLITFEGLRGLRTKISLFGAGILGILVQFGVVTPELFETIVKAVLPFGIYFAVEHWEDIEKKE